MMDFKAWRESIVSVATQIADGDYQRRSWFGKSSTEVSSPDEMVCQISDDLLFEEFLQTHSAKLSAEQLTTASLLLSKLNEYSEATPENLDPEQVINDPAWHDIMSAAAAFVRAMAPSEI